MIIFFYIFIFIALISSIGISFYLLKEEEKKENALQEKQNILVNEIDILVKDIKDYLALLSQDNKAFIMDEINKMLYEIMILYEINKEE
jgi:hypothetical protein